MHTTSHTTPYTTRTGLRIGSAYTPPQAPVYLDHDALRLQRALLGDRPATDWDGVAIALALGLVLWLIYGF